MPGDRRPLAPGQIDSRALYRAQQSAERHSPLLYILLGLVSANRKALHKAVASCDPDAAAARPVDGAPAGAGPEPDA